MPNSASTDRPRTAPNAGTGARGLSVDELAAQRNTPALPPEPVFTIDLVEVEIESGKRGRKYVADLEELAQRNALAAAEARALALEQRRHLEEATDGRRTAERKIATLHRELQAAVAERQRLELRNRSRAAEPVVPPVVSDPATGSSEVATLREAVEQQQRLLGEGRERLASALRERDTARIEARQATEARDRAKRSLDRATDLLHEHAVSESDADSAPAGAAAGPQTTADLRAARLGVEARLLRLTDELDRMTAHAEQLEARVAAETVRADDAEARVGELTVSERSADGESASARDELAAAVARETEHEQTNAQLTARVGELETQLGTAIADRSDADRQVRELEQEVSAVQGERDDARAAFEHVERTAATHTEELEAARQAVADLGARVERLTSNAGTATAALAEADQVAADRARALETLAAEHAQAVDDLSERLAQTEADRDRLRSTADDAASRVAALEAAVATASGERDDGRAQLAELATTAEDHLRKTIAERDEARGRVVDLTAAVEGRTADLERTSARVTDLEHSLATEAAARTTAEARVDDLESRLASVIELDDETSARRADLETSLRRAQDEIATRDAELLRLTDEQAALDGALRQSQDAAASRDADLARLTDDQTALEAALEEARGEVATLARRAADAESARHAAEARITADHQTAQAQVDRLGDRILELEEMVRTHEAPPAATELDDLAAVATLEPDPPAPPPAPTTGSAPPPSSDLLRALRSELSDVNTLDGESRRSLLSDLSDLADANPPPSTP
jgi:chemotaxis protein MotB